jgi:hypothetical protein
MSDGTAGRAIATTGSTNSGQGSAPLSDPFVAVTAKDVSTLGSVMRVEAPVGSAQLLVRRSSRVASSRSHPSRAAAPGVVSGLVDAPPGSRHRPGSVLRPVLEADTSAARLVVPAGGVGDPWGSTAPQFGLTTGTGRKRSATSAAPSSGLRGPVAKRLASAADFSPTHFDEPVSGGPVPPSPNHPSNHPLPARVMLGSPVRVTGSRTGSLPSSSPISRNPLLEEIAPMVVQTPSPPRRRTPSFRTHDGNAAWAAAQGLLPVREDFVAPGYAPAHLVGGIRYTVHSPQAQLPRPPRPITGRASVANDLHGEHSGVGLRQQPWSSQAPTLQQQVSSRDVRLCKSFIYAHMLTCG